MQWDDQDLDLYGRGTSKWKYYLRVILTVKEEVTIATRKVIPFLSFSVYLILYTIVATNAFPGQSAYEQQNAIRSALSKKSVLNSASSTLVTFESIGDFDDFWTWLSEVAIDCAYSEQGTDPNIDICSRSFHLLGALRLRQARVGADSCAVSSAHLGPPGTAASGAALSPDAIAAYGLFATSLSLQAYVLECEPDRALAPSPAEALFGAAGDPRCGFTPPQQLPWSDLPFGQVCRVAGCYAGVDQVRRAAALRGPGAARRRGRRPERRQCLFGCEGAGAEQSCRSNARARLRARKHTRARALTHTRPYTGAACRLPPPRPHGRRR